MLGVYLEASMNGSGVKDRGDASERIIDRLFGMALGEL